MTLVGLSPRFGRADGARRRVPAGLPLIAGHKSTTRAADIVRRQTEDALMKRKHIHVKARPPDEEAKDLEAAKTARLRALRLAKEAADRDAARLAAAAAASPPKSRARRASQATPRQAISRQPAARAS